MAEFNTYPIFVADQVLTADHLNEVVNYLEEQDRLTRNRLIGIGIVCGLELKASTEQIQISGGCGVTSEGYLIVRDPATFTHYHPYTLPEYFSPEYKPLYEKWHMWELLTTEKSLESNDAIFIKNNSSFLVGKVVVLLLEMTERPLKNCIEGDCDDKGDIVEFNVKPLLVDTVDLNKFIKSKIIGGDEPKHSVIPKLHSIQLKRFNVPVNELSDTNDVFNAFLKIVDEKTLKQLAEVLNYCYLHYKTLLNEGSNPFANVFEKFISFREQIKTSNPLFIQYYYDWIDDIIKAYYEFKDKIFYVDAMCCPDESLFPLHLMLGEADKDTAIDLKSKYRNYFIYSPLFNDQTNLLAEVKLLFRRLKAMVENYQVPASGSFANAVVKITPSEYLGKPLSYRCIPYYYNALGIYKVWSWFKTRKGHAKFNLSYNAAQYNNADEIINPLKYDIERFTFFRIEGHIGKHYNSALTNVVGQRDQFNLPFDVKALSTATISQFFNADDHKCQFNDLDSLFKVLVAELKCKLGDFECMASKIPYHLYFTNILEISNLDSRNFSTGFVGSANNLSQDILPELQFNRNLLSILKLNFANLQLPDYVRGSYLKNNCITEDGTIGRAYLNAVDRGESFTRPSSLKGVDLNKFLSMFNNLSLIYAYLFHFIDCVENTFAASVNKSLDDFDADIFKKKYKALMDITEDLAKCGEYLEQLDPMNDNYSELLKNLQSIGFYDLVVRIHSLLQACLDKSLAALKEEYDQRKQDIQLLTNFMNYFKKCPGMEHKAGVPKGGTFILVYHETAPLRLSGNYAFVKNLVENLPGALSSGVLKHQELATISDLVGNSYVQSPQLLKNFQLALGKFVDTCKDMDDDTKIQIHQILTNIPEKPRPPVFRVPEKAVIADFYLPYICCSDCPPVSYVIPKAPPEVLTIDIIPTTFCNNDEKKYTVQVSPEGGKLTASNGGIAEGSLDFSPKGLSPGTNTLTYKAPDGRSISLDVQITASFTVDFTSVKTGDGLTVQFNPTDSASGKAILWDFGDGATSEDLSPAHTYQFSEEKKTFIVVLDVTDGPCVAEAKKPISLDKPVPAEFDLDPKTFCVNDEKTYEFKINPFPGVLKDIKNSDRLIIKLDRDNNKLTITPSDQKIAKTKDYHLDYMGIGLDIQVVVPDASFFMNIVRSGGDHILTLSAKQTDANQYIWKVTQRDNSQTFETNKVSFSLMKYKFNAGDTIEINLTIGYKLSSRICEGKASFSLTEEIFFKHVDTGDFDNKTTA